MRMSIVEQVKIATKPQNRMALAGGAILGGFVPAASYVLAHHEVSQYPALWLLVAGALLFSAMSVFGFGVSAFGSKAKSLGFTVLLEGVLVFASTPALSWAALALLVAVNAIATGTNLAVESKASRSKPQPKPQPVAKPRLRAVAL